MREIPGSLQDLMAQMQASHPAKFPYQYWQNSVAQELFRQPESLQFEALLAALDRVQNVFGTDAQSRVLPNGVDGVSFFAWFVNFLIKQDFKLSQSDYEELFERCHGVNTLFRGRFNLAHGLVEQLKSFQLTPELSVKWRPIFCELRQMFSPAFSPNYGDFEWSPVPPMNYLAELLGEQIPDFLERGDAWADAAIADLEAMDASTRVIWLSLFEHAQNSGDSRPKDKWLKRADELLQLVGKDEFLRHAQGWFALYGKDDGYWFADREERNDAHFKGLVWMASRIENAAIVPALGAALRGSFKARGRAGVRSQKVGNACIWALGRRDESEAASHLVAAKNRVKNGSVLKTLEKTIEIVAVRAQMTPEDLEEIAVPDFGLENGVIARDFDNARVEIGISSGKAVWNWISEGKTVKVAPASVKRDFSAELKELKTSVAELERVFAAQKERLDGLLRAEKIWDFSVWKTRYLEHPLMALISRRVIWVFEAENAKNVAVPRENGFVDSSGEKIEIPENSRVKLWHPLSDSSENVLGWRRYFEENALKQPFKQAHREIYLLTDAERATRTYSNRFAAHILKQHQFNSLCAARGWKNSLRLMVDDAYPPATKIWPNHDLRAEFWIEGIGENYGTDTNEAGTYLRLATDQVRFYRRDAPQNSAHAGGGGYSVGYRQAPTEALELATIAPLIFSETMRDVDLFVGVSSLGSDEAWRDGGPQGHFRDYWQDYSFGELGESAKSRADVLSRLLPKLKIRAVATLESRFLRVQGKLRAYKIHLGSGNILMEPNDQYLCIVPARDENEGVFLPFEDDRTLAVILSKAFMLADDDKIKDAGVLRQIKA